MYCTQCGLVLTSGAAFCSACGRPASPADAPSAPLSPESIPSAPARSYPAPPAYAIPTVPAFPYAGFWLRFVAYLIDATILNVVLFGIVALGILSVGGMSFLRSLGGRMNSDDPSFAVAIVSVLMSFALVAMAAMWLYYALMESSAYQGTLGKMALGLTVTDLSGQRVTFGRATGRFFAKVVTGLVPFAIGYIMAGFTQKKQALHDMIASCLVLKKP